MGSWVWLQITGAFKISDTASIDNTRVFTYIIRASENLGSWFKSLQTCTFVNKLQTFFKKIAVLACFIAHLYITTPKTDSKTPC